MLKEDRKEEHAQYNKKETYTYEEVNQYAHTLVEQIQALRGPVREMNRQFIRQLVARMPLRPEVEPGKAARYLESVALLRRYFDNPALTTDVIVGFPGETEEEFQKSRDFVDKVNFYETHIFKYSRREGTRAAAMENQVSEQEKARRSAVLIELGEKKRKAYEQSFLGKEVEVLVEEEAVIEGRPMQTGHTKEYIRIAFEGDKSLKNTIVKVRVDNDLQIIH